MVDKLVVIKNCVITAKDRINIFKKLIFLFYIFLYIFILFLNVTFKFDYLIFTLILFIKLTLINILYQHDGYYRIGSFEGC